VGPTAAGKSELSLRIAQSLGGEVVNGDSMQLYRGMDIGTAKLGVAERAGLTIPGGGLLKVARHAAQMGPLKEGRVEGLAEPQCCRTVSGLGATLVKKACGGHIPGTEKRVAPSLKLLSLNIRKIRLGRDRGGRLGRSGWR